MTDSDRRLGVSLDVSAIPPRPAGAGRYVIELARELSRSDEVGLFLVARKSDAPRWRSTAPSASVLPLAPDSRPARIGFEQALLGPAVLRASPSIKVHHGPHYTLPRRLGRLASVVTINDMTFFDHPEWHERAKVPFFQRAIKRSAAQADVMICVSEVTADRLKALTKPAGDVVVVPHGVDHDRFKVTADAEEDADHIAKAGLTGDRPYILHLGTIEPRKGVVDLVRAFGPLAAEVDDVELVLAGLRAWGAAEVDAAIAASPAQSRIRLLGYIEDGAVPALLRRAAAVAYPSYEEGFGLPALEALACGAPLVTSSGTAMAEVSGGAAWTCPAGDPDALAGVLSVALGASAEDLARRRQLGVDRSAEFTWQRTAEGHLTVYRSAAG